MSRIASFLAVTLLAGCSMLAADKPALDATFKTKTPSGLGYTILATAKAGAPTAKVGDTASVHYTGWLTSGKQFDSSVASGRPFSFPIGRGKVIAGWDEGVAGMKVGERRKLVVPGELGYGAAGTNGIPANATLIFEVELLELN